jgi:hypothetical protein
VLLIVDCNLFDKLIRTILSYNVEACIMELRDNPENWKHRVYKTTTTTKTNKQTKIKQYKTKQNKQKTKTKRSRLAVMGQCAFDSRLQSI